MWDGPIVSSHSSFNSVEVSKYLLNREKVSFETLL